jgi:hypothetical protein
MLVQRILTQPNWVGYRADLPRNAEPRRADIPQDDRLTILQTAPITTSRQESIHRMSIHRIDRPPAQAIAGARRNPYCRCGLNLRNVFAVRGQSHGREKNPEHIQSGAATFAVFE